MRNLLLNYNMDSEDKRDFELLTRHHSQTSTPSMSSLSSRPITSSPDEIWPLYITPNFIEHYITGEIIGTGSYAEVRECIDTLTLERCALKIINKDYLRRQAPRALSNQMQEIRLLRHLRHPNIITMRGCLFKGPRIYIILEYCSFVLSDLLDEQIDNKLNVSIARDLFCQLCLGLNYLHSCGVVHRDIKPQNLLITNCGTLKIIDFGVSQILSMWNYNDLCSNYEGSPLFQAPEVVCGQPEYAGFKVDVWSSGVTLYLMLCGQYPFMDDALLGLYDKILGQDFQVPDFLPTKLVLTDLFAIMLDKNSDQRATIDQVLEHPWLKFQMNHDSDDEHVEFVDLVLSRQPQQQLSSQLFVPSYQRDVYKSISVLPYLYKHHFPDLPVTKVKRSSSELSDSSTCNLLTTLSLNNSSSPSVSPTSSASIDNQRAPSSASNDRSTSEETNSPNRVLDDETEVEWGTKEQYHLMKVPPIRANRVNYPRRRRSRHSKRTRRHGIRLSRSL